MSHLPPDDLPLYARDLIRHKARRMVRHGVVPARDEEDARQDLSLRVVQRLPRFDPARAAMATFLSNVVASGSTSMIRHRHAAKRAGRRRGLEEKHLLHDPWPGIEARLDMEQMLTLTHPAARPVADRLMEGQTNVVGIGRECGLSRQQVRSQIQGLRRQFGGPETPAANNRASAARTLRMAPTGGTPYAR